MDECSTPGANNNCSSNADCVNELGSFGCNCKSGYTGDGVNCNGTFRNVVFEFWIRKRLFEEVFSHIKVKVSFKPFADVDECIAPSANNCSSNADCVNEPGSFECNCRPGYTGDGVNCNGMFINLVF